MSKASTGKQGRTVFFISDGTGITAEALGLSLLSQFDDYNFDCNTLPYIDTVEKAYELVERINKIANEDVRPIIFDTVVNREIREVLAQCNGFTVDIFSTFLSPLENELAASSSYTVGKAHGIDFDKDYPRRIEAVHYALDNDDGGMTREYGDADIVLVGVSRCGKTPTCIYLALQYGIRAANYPITEEDLGTLKLPAVLKPHKDKIYGLTINPQRLHAIRTERKPNSRYASARQCELEVKEVEEVFRREQIPCLDTTHYSVEEISARILAKTDLRRHLMHNRAAMLSV